MSNFDMRDEIAENLYHASLLLQQLGENHNGLPFKDGHLTQSVTEEYASQYERNDVLINIIAEKVARAEQIINKMAV